MKHLPAAKPLVIQWGVTAAEHQSQELLHKHDPLQEGQRTCKEKRPIIHPRKGSSGQGLLGPGTPRSPPEPDENGCITYKETKAQLTYDMCVSG